jgi:hypothetical protein
MIKRELVVLLSLSVGMGACGTSTALDRRGAVLSRGAAREVVRGPGVLHGYIDDPGARVYLALATGQADDCERAGARALAKPAWPMGEPVTVVLSVGEALCLLGPRAGVELMWHFVPDERWPLREGARAGQRPGSPLNAVSPRPWARREVRVRSARVLLQIP